MCNIISLTWYSILKWYCHLFSEDKKLYIHFEVVACPGNSQSMTINKKTLHLLLRCSAENCFPSIFVARFILPNIFLSWSFLGGLSLHLNHLIVERMSAHYWQFGTLPIGIFLSNLVSGQLETSLMTSYCHF